MNRKKRVFIAKQLLLNHVCENCARRSTNYYCLLKAAKGPAVSLVESNDTCEEWSERVEGFGKGEIIWKYGVS